MQKLLVIGVGGFIGALLRYGIGTSVQTMFKQSSFPLGTLAVKLTGLFCHRDSHLLRGIEGGVIH